MLYADSSELAMREFVDEHYLDKLQRSNRSIVAAQACMCNIRVDGARQKFVAAVDVTTLMYNVLFIYIRFHFMQINNFSKNKLFSNLFRTCKFHFLYKLPFENYHHFISSKMFTVTKFITVLSHILTHFCIQCSLRGRRQH